MKVLIKTILDIGVTAKCFPLPKSHRLHKTFFSLDPAHVCKYYGLVP